MTDKERIEAIMQEYHLNNVAFCNKVGMNQATLSNILGGRTNPSLQVLRSIIDAFPEINSNWIFMGVGEMKKSAEQNSGDAPLSMAPSTGDLFSTALDPSGDPIFGSMPQASAPSSSNHYVHGQNAKPSNEVSPASSSISVSDIVTGVVSQLQKPQRKIVEVRIFFDDGTFETFSSR